MAASVSIVAGSDGGLLTTVSPAGSTCAIYEVNEDGAQGLQLNYWVAGSGPNEWGGWKTAKDGRYRVRVFGPAGTSFDFKRVHGPAQSALTGGGAGTSSDPWLNLCKPIDFRMPNSFWNLDVSAAPLDTNSAAMATWIVNHPGGYGSTWAFNAHGSATAIQCVDNTTPLVDWSPFNFQKKDPRYYPPATFAAVLEQVPTPSYLRPTQGGTTTDHEVSIYNTVTGDIWDLWEAGQNQTITFATAGVSGGNPVSYPAPGWGASWGGKSNISGPGYFPNGLGASASECVLMAGAMGIRETIAAVNASTGLNHALNISSATVGIHPHWPAQNGDGNDGTCPIDEGTWFRYDPTIDVEGLHGLTRIAKTVLLTMQQFGCIITDQGGQNAIAAEDPGAIIASGQPDPWALINQGKPDYLIMQNVDWSHLQFIQPNWGRPT